MFHILPSSVDIHVLNLVQMVFLIFHGDVKEHLHASSAIKTSSAFRRELIHKLQQFVLHMAGHKTIFQHGVECYAKLIALIIMVCFTQLDT